VMHGGEGGPVWCGTQRGRGPVSDSSPCVARDDAGEIERERRWRLGRVS
jgi:hypothetical protein